MQYVSVFTLFASMFLTAASPLLAASQSSGRDNRVEWQQLNQWKTEGQPLDVAHSLDGKLVYILNNQQQVLVYDATGKLQGKVNVTEGTNAIDIAPQGEALHLIDNKTNTFTTLAMNFVYDIDIDGSPVKGNLNAPVTVTIFTDFECPYCIKMEALLNQVYDKNKEKIKMVFKNFPLVAIHPMADASHRAAVAAEKQGKFWEFHDRLFSTEKLSNDTIDAIAKDLGLDLARLKKDMQSPEIQTRIARDLAAGEKAAVTGTPTVFVNGRKLQQRSPEGFQQMIDEELRKQGK